jgi:Zinc carboxypeptidase
MQWRVLPLAAAATAVVALLALARPGDASAQDPNQVTGLTVVQRDGFATLSWSPVPGATDYQIERVPVSADNVPTGPAAITGVWRPNRQVPGPPTFADAGFSPGDRFQWQVRARFGTTPQPFSEPVFATTVPSFGPAEFLTQFERSQGAEFTSYESELEWTRRIDEASSRVRVVTIGRTALGREINLFIIGNPAPPGTAQAIASGPTAGANCNVHGNEPSGREGCFMMIRKLAFSDDPWVIDVLSHATVLIVPSINGDGRAANTRGNSTGQDLNRDHGRLTQPETLAFAAFLRDYTPEVMVDGHEFGNTGTCDLPLLWPRHSNTAESVHDESKEGLVEGWFYREAGIDGWWPCPYPLPGIDGAQSFTRVTGLKNMIVTLVEARSSGGATRPNEGSTQNNRRRKAYSHLWTIGQALEYHRASLPAIRQAIADGIAFQASNTGRVVFHGDWDVEAFPAPHPGDSPPPNNPPGPDQILDPPPCGYFLTNGQYTTKLNDSGSLPVELRTSPAERLAAHGIAVQDRPAGHIVRMAQPLRGLINIVLDGQTPPAPIIAAQRLFECPHAEAVPGSLAANAVEDDETTLALTVANRALEPDEDLNWTIAEAESDCSAQSDLGWVAVDDTSGSTRSSSSTSVDITFDATGLTAPDVHTGLLCLSSNDPGAPVIEVPLTLQVRYPFQGFLATFLNPPFLNEVNSNGVQRFQFRLGGDRGLDILASGSPASRQIECSTKAPIGPLEPTGTPGRTGLSYDGDLDRYTYPWKPPRDNDYAGTCREFLLTLDDQSVHAVWLHFTK